jgi:hypothetical protein
MERLGPQYALDEPQLALFNQMQEEKDKLTKELYFLMVEDKDII